MHVGICGYFQIYSKQWANSVDFVSPYMHFCNKQHVLLRNIRSLGIRDMLNCTQQDKLHPTVRNFFWYFRFECRLYNRVRVWVLAVGTGSA